MRNNTKPIQITRPARRRKINIKMKIAYIAHPISGNVHYNIRQVVKKVGEINKNEPEVVPFAPYIVDCMALDDNKPEDRQRGFKNNYHYFESGMINELRLYGNFISKGMADEIEWAAKFGIEIKNFITESEAENTFFTDILNAVSKATRITPVEILSKSRRRELVMARQILIGIYYEMNRNTSCVELAKKLDCDHSTVLYNKNTCSNLLFSDKAFKALYNVALSLL